MISTARRRRFGLKVVLLALTLTAVATTNASAGNLLVTGHDFDLHCSASNGTQQCHYTKIAVKFARQGAPNPDKPVLVLDRPDFDMDVALDFAFSPGFPRLVVEPTSTQFANMRINTRKFSAIAVASDDSCGGCDLNPVGLEDTNAIIDRKADIKRFFNNGGGIAVGAGADNGNDPGDRFYRFVPIPVGGVAVSPPFCLTPRGIDLGLHDQECPNPDRHNGTQDDINCCATHNSFEAPASSSALKVAERDSEGFAETLIASGTISGGEIVGGELKLTVDPKQTREDRRTCFDFKVTSGGQPVNRATVHFGGQDEKTNNRGKVEICKTFSDPGRKGAKATKSGFDPDRTSVLVTAGPGFTGKR